MSISSSSTNFAFTNSTSTVSISTSADAAPANSVSTDIPSTSSNSTTANSTTINSGSVSVASSSSNLAPTDTNLNGTYTTPINSSTNIPPASSNCAPANDSTYSKPELTNSFINFSTDTTSDTKTHLKCDCTDSLTYPLPESDRLVTRSITLSIKEEMHTTGTQNVDDLTIDVVIHANSDVPKSGDSAGRTGDTSIHSTPGRSNSCDQSGSCTPNPSTLASFFDDSSLDDMPKPKMSSTPKVNVTHNVPSSPTPLRKRYCSPTQSSLMREQATKPKSGKCSAHPGPSVDHTQCASVSMSGSPRVCQPPNDWTPRVKRHSCVGRHPVQVSSACKVRSMPPKYNKETTSTDSLDRISYPQAPFLSRTPRFG